MENEMNKLKKGGVGGTFGEAINYEIACKKFLENEETMQRFQLF